jgi:hypothetical protein
MYSDTGNTTSLVLGFPIRTSSDPRSVGSSPRHIAASHVLHRPLMPRHPPCALKHLQQKTQKPKNFFRENYTTTNQHHSGPKTPHREPGPHDASLMLATTIHESNTTPHHQVEQQHTSHPTQGPGKHGPVVSGPNSVLGSLIFTTRPHDGDSRGLRRSLHVHQNPTHYRQEVHLTNRSGLGEPRYAGRPKTRGAP